MPTNFNDVHELYGYSVVTVTYTKAICNCQTKFIFIIYESSKLNKDGA